MDQGADTGHDEQHDEGQLVHLEGEVHLQRANRNPRPVSEDERPLRSGLQSEERAEHRKRNGERGDQDTGADDRHERLCRRPQQRQRAVQHEAEQRQRGREPDQVDRGPGHPSLRRFMFCRLTDCLWR